MLDIDLYKFFNPFILFCSRHIYSHMTNLFVKKKQIASPLEAAYLFGFDNTNYYIRCFR